jgi:hypothetical protein
VSVAKTRASLNRLFGGRSGLLRCPAAPKEEPRRGGDVMITPGLNVTRCWAEQGDRQDGIRTVVPSFLNSSKWLTHSRAERF